MIASYQVSLAEVMMAENRFADAEPLLRQGAAEGKREKESELEGEANAALASALLAQKKLAEAEGVVRQMRQIQTQNPGILIQAAIVDAQLSAAQGKTTAAGKSLSSIVSKAAKMGCIPCQFDARLALGEFEMKSGQSAAGRVHLQALQRDAQAADFGLIARQAAEAEAVSNPK